jgi:DNA polymerase-1
MSTLLLVDGNAIIHRAFHALPPFRAPDGRPTGAVYGFFSTLFSAIKQFEPTHIAVAFDVAGPTFRHEEFKDYKAKRIKAPPELYDQIPMIQDILQVTGIPQFGVTGFEADDVLATIVAKTSSSQKRGSNDSRLRGNDGGVKIIILTGDLDTLQLVGQNVSVCALKKGIKESIIYDLKTVKEKFGFDPQFMIEYKMLKGDSSDNVPGIPGIGEKTAAALISKYQTIENIYRHIQDLPARIQTNLRSHKKQNGQTRQLLALRDDVPIDFSLESAEVPNYNQPKVVGQFQKLGFKSLIGRLRNESRAKQTSLL